MNGGRRRFLAGALALASRPRPQAPHYLVQVVLSGGFDPVLTFDPKHPARDRGIDCGYRASERVTGSSRLYGPLIGQLLRHDRELTLVHGVQVNTVDHEDGFRRLYAGGRYRQGGLGDEIAQALPGSALIPHLDIDIDVDQLANPLRPQIPREARPPLPAPSRGLTVAAGALVSLSSDARRGPSWFAEMLAVQRAEAQARLADAPDQLRWVERGIHRTGLLRSLAASILPVPGFVSPLRDGLLVALHAVADNHARFIRVSAPRLLLDSHTDNLAIQTARVPPLFADVARFIDELQRRANAFGSLWKQTTLVVCAELGRYPRTNAAGGKDHWPETSWLLAGKGIRPGVTIGATDNRLVGMPVDYTTGRPRRNGRPMVLEAISATLLQVAGADLARLECDPALRLGAALAA